MSYSVSFRGGDKKAEIIENCKLAIAEVTDTANLEKKAEKLSQECDTSSELIRKCVDENAHVSVDQNKYSEKYDALVKRYTESKKSLML